MRKNNNLFKIIALIIVFYFVFSMVSKLFESKPEQIVDVNEEEYVTNNYVNNHHVEYVEDTSSSELNTAVATGAREKFTKIIGNNKDEVTLMVYMIGTDLESQSGAATKDLNEMLYAGIDNNINIIVQTGGCKRWRNNVISSSEIERYTVNSDSLLRLDTKIKNGPMTNKETLSSFIKYSADNFPANRYMLILWDHGGGSVTGYGYDEKYPSNPSMSPDIIASAIKDSGIKFDFVGFDACLMANLETCLALEPYADYLIGSEEVEPGSGWLYKSWIKKLDSNTSLPTLDLAKIIIDDYTKDSLSYDRSMQTTESVIDLGELAYAIKEPLYTFSKATASELKNDNYQKIALARSNTKEFSSSSYLDQVDLVDLASKFNVDGSNELIKAVKSAVKYNKTSNINNAYGLSAYFPYASLSKVNDMVKIYDNINMDKEYTNVVKSFASYAASGQVLSHNNNSTGNSIFDILMSDSYTYDDYYSSNNNIYDILSGSYYGNDGYYGYDSIYGSGYDSWYEPSSLDILSSFFGRNHLVDLKQLNIIESNNQRVVSLSNEQWDLIDSVYLNTFIDDSNGYIDLGYDNTFEWNNKGELIVEHDGTWLSVNDHIVAYYMIEDTYINEDNYKTVGIIPAYLNNERVNLIVNFTNENPYGIIIGASKKYDSDIQAKGLIEINDGDHIKFIADYYSYNGEYTDEYQIGDELIVDSDLVLNNIYLDNDYIYTYCFKDIYGNNLYTPKTIVKK